jgi:hypothetical protein
MNRFKVLISDDLSPAAINIFKQRGLQAAVPHWPVQTRTLGRHRGRHVSNRIGAQDIDCMRD